MILLQRLSTSWCMNAILAFLLAVSFVVCYNDAQRVGASCVPGDISIQAGADCARGTGQPAELFGDGSIFQRIVDILLFLVGAIAVVMLILGGIRYIISGGDQAKVTAAKNTILYAIIGLVVAILAYAGVHFVIQTLLNNIS